MPVQTNGTSLGMLQSIPHKTIWIILLYLMKHIPNIISIFRLVFSCILFSVVDNITLLFTLYILCGISDIADGYIARRMKAETNLGAKLDSIADVTLYAFIVFMLISQTDILNDKVTLYTLALTVIIKSANLFITRLKFKQWNILHTLGNKSIGLIVYLSMPIFYFQPDISSFITLIICIIAVIASLEESLILITSDNYNVNRKNLFSTGR